MSPVAAFVRDTCTVAAGNEVLVSDLFARWKAWCEDNGHKPGSVQPFGRDLHAVVPALRVFRPHGGHRHYIGLTPGTAHNGSDRGSTGSDSRARG